MRGASLIAVVLLSGCVLDRSGTIPDRSGIDASIDGAVAGLDAGRSDAGRSDAATPDAGVPPACADGDVRVVPCGGCGMLAEQCSAGTWSDLGGCEEMPPCPPGMVETETEGCGACGARTRTRTCGGCAGWGEWSAFGECAGGECTPGEVRSNVEQCSCNRGSRTVTDMCNTSCIWERTDTPPCSLQTCRTPVFGTTICPGDTAWVGCPSSFSARRCECIGMSGEFGNCDDSTCR